MSNESNLRIKDRGAHVTAINAVLNMTDGDMLLSPFANPEHRQLIKPGLFTYPRGTTVPIKWEWDSNSLIEFGGHGYMWQPGGYAEVYFKRDSMPKHDKDGTVLYRRRHGYIDEQYLILGVYPGEIKIVKSFTAAEFFWKELNEAVLETLGVLRSEHLAAIAAQPDAALMFANAIKRSHGRIQTGDANVFEKLSSTPSDKWKLALTQLSTEERARLASADPGSQEGLKLAKKILDGLSVGIGAITAGIAAVILAIGMVLAAFAVVTWPAILTLAGILGAVLLLTGAVVAFLQLAAYIIGLFIPNSDSTSVEPVMALLSA